MIDSLPPQNLEAETGVLGSVLMDNSVIDDVMLIIKYVDFYRDSHQLIYQSITAIHNRGERVDVITLEEELKRKNSLDAAGGIDAIFAILHSVPHAANAIYYAQIVKQKAIARAVIVAAHTILKAGYSTEHTAEELVGIAEKEVYKLSDTQTSREVSLAEIEVPAVVEHVHDRIERGAGPEGLSFGLEHLDSFARLAPEGFTILGARPSMGKTAMALQICESVVEVEHRPALFVSLEMGNQSLAMRMLSGRSGVPASILRRAVSLSESDRHRINEAANAYASMAPLVLADSPITTVSQIASTARRAKNRYGDLGLIVVDYLGLIESESPRIPRHEQVAEISKRLKTLTRELCVPVIALSQLNRNVESREDRRPRMADLRESGAVEQDADLILLLHRPDYYDPNDSPGIAEVIVAKNRNGETGTVQLIFNRATTRFVDIQPEYA